MGSSRHEPTVAAYGLAREVFEPAGVTFGVVGTRQNLARAEARLAARRKGGEAAE